MTEQPIVSAQPHRSDMRDLIVPPSILVCAIAAGVASHLHFDVPTELAAALGMLLFSLGLVAHVLFGRPAIGGRRVKRKRAPREAQAPAVQRAPDEDQLQPVWSAADGDPTAPVPLASNAPAELSLERAAETAAEASWDLRPGDLAQAGPVRAHGGPELTAPAAEPTPTVAAADGTTAEAPSAHDAPEHERITAVLRRLGEELRATAPGAAAVVDAGAQPEPDPVKGELKPQNSALSAAPAGAEQAEAKAGHSLSDAVDALRVTMEVMRAASAQRPVAPHVEAPSAAPVANEAALRLAAVADALSRERLEVFLEPIIGLVDDTTRHFEVSVRLRGADGSALDPGFLAAHPSGAEIVPLLDAVRVRHAAGIALKLERSGREGAVFSDVGGPSLRSPRFVQGVAERQAQGIADRIVLTFLQNEVRGLGPAQLSALAALRDLGFRFALQGIADLDMDFETLRLNGFEFVKLEAEVFLEGLPLLGGRVPSSDICRHFAGLGMTVIVGRVDDEGMRTRILGLGVLFGQGHLFGGPRPVRIADARPHQAAGAAA